MAAKPAARIIHSREPANKCDSWGSQNSPIQTSFSLTFSHDHPWQRLHLKDLKLKSFLWPKTQVHHSGVFTFRARHPQPEFHGHSIQSRSLASKTTLLCGSHQYTCSSTPSCVLTKAYLFWFWFLFLSTASQIQTAFPCTQVLFPLLPVILSSSKVSEEERSPDPLQG